MTGNEIRRIVLEYSYKNGLSHIGSCLSIADIMAELYSGVLRPQDRFILSKGHAALAWYAALYLSGKWPDKQTLIEAAAKHGHPDHNLPGVDFSTGSLGMGITYAVGVAEALKRDSTDGKVYCLVSDAECQEGSFWEALRVAETRNLRLVVIVDANGSGALGGVHDNLFRMISGFGIGCWGASDSVDSLKWHLKNAFTGYEHPGALLVHTVLGKGVPFMENELAWHYKSLDDETYRRAMAELT